VLSNQQAAAAAGQVGVSGTSMDTHSHSHSHTHSHTHTHTRTQQAGVCILCNTVISYPAPLQRRNRSLPIVCGETGAETKNWKGLELHLVSCFREKLICVSRLSFQRGFSQTGVKQLCIRQSNTLVFGGMAQQP